MKLGSKLSEVLSRLGFTPEKYTELKLMCGLPPECDCKKREDWLDNIPEAFIRGGIIEARKALLEWHERWDKPQ